MSYPLDSLFLGVDGGGSGCRARLVDGAGTVLAEEQGAAANVWTDFENAVSALRDLSEKLAQSGAFDLTQTDRVTAHFGLAGVLNDGVANRVAAALPFANVSVSDDRATSLAGALGPRDGIVVAIGTGSFVAQRRKGNERFLGGWGYHAGDQASGAWLGRELLADALMCHDGIIPASPLLKQILTTRGGADGIAGFARAASPTDFAAHAPHLMDAADAGDAGALRIVARGIEYILSAVNTLAPRTGEVICPLGGLGPRYVPYLPATLRADIAPPAGSALDGAIAIAHQQAEALA